MMPMSCIDRQSTNNNTSIAAMASSSATSSCVGGGKAARARKARSGEILVGNRDDHRSCGGAPTRRELDPTTADPRLYPIVVALEAMEKQARIKHRPHMQERKQVPMDNHGSMIDPEAENNKNDRAASSDILQDAGTCDLSEQNLRSLTIVPTISPLHFAAPLETLTRLDLSRNELWDLPNDLSSIPNVAELNLSRNWFQTLPESLGHLTKLVSLNLSHNMLRSSRKALLLDSGILQSLSCLRMLDLSFNQKWGHQKKRDALLQELPDLIHLKMTICFPPPEGAFVGESAADRDATLLRSQLEPYSTTALRRRLVADFGDPVLPPERYPRAQVMSRLLELYEEEGGAQGRTVICVNGTLVAKSLRDELLKALCDWKDAWSCGNQERMSIQADHYMILSSPTFWKPGSKKALKAAGKIRKHQRIWDLAQTIMASVDSAFASRYTALAVTHGFQGSPHIDRQNLSPFYGLALGDFEDGTGGIMVECSARLVAHVNTKNRLGRVDGRYPHWVAPYDTSKDRYSLIYYQTEGENLAVGPAIFSLPTTTTAV